MNIAQEVYNALEVHFALKLPFKSEEHFKSKLNFVLNRTFPLKVQITFNVAFALKMLFTLKCANMTKSLQNQLCKATSNMLKETCTKPLHISLMSDQLAGPVLYFQSFRQFTYFNIDRRRPYTYLGTPKT